jgi:hypothetical protein
MAEKAEEVLKKAIEKHQKDEEREARILRGEPVRTVLKL